MKSQIDVVTSIFLAIMLVLAGGSLNPLDCKPLECFPCFSLRIECFSTNVSHIIPPQIDEKTTSLKLAFTSPNASTVQLQKRDIQRYTSLEKLYLSGDFDSIQVDALSSLTNLTLLHITSTVIQQLPDQLLANNKYMKEILLSRNFFTKIPLQIFNGSKRIIVTKFTFSGHGNVTLPCETDGFSLPSKFYNFRRLESLDLSFNSFHSPNCPTMSESFFAPVSLIRELFIGGTNLIHKDEQALSVLIKLSYLDISSLAPYKSCPTNVSHLLKWLPTSVAQLQVLNWEVSLRLKESCLIISESIGNLSRLTSLQTLSFAYGDGIFGPTLFRETFPTLPSLTKLNIAGCRISSIEEDAFAGFPLLSQLTLTGNPLGSKDLRMMSYPAINIRTLSLSNTDIRSDAAYNYRNSNIFCDFPNLATIEFLSNSLSRLPIFVRNQALCNSTASTGTSLKKFVASYNNLKYFTEDDNENSNICQIFPSLYSITLSFNQLESLTGLDLCTNLEKLQLDHNRLLHFDPAELAKVFSHLTKVTNLDISFNNIKDMDADLFSKMKSLKNLFLNNNNLEKLGENAFDGNPELVSLNLRRNFIQFLEPATFSGLKKLKEFSIEENKLSTLSPDLLAIVAGLQLHDFDVQVNPFDCDCDKKYFQKWIREHVNLVLVEITYIQCNSPLNQREKLVYSYEDDVFECVVKDILIYGGIVLGVFLVAVALAVPCYRYRWYIRNMKVVWKAFVGSLEVVKLEHICLYDAYVSFDSSCLADSKWVVEELIPAIERSPDDMHTASTSSCPSVTEEVSITSIEF